MKLIKIFIFIIIIYKKLETKKIYIKINLYLNT